MTLPLSSASSASLELVTFTLDAFEFLTPLVLVLVVLGVFVSASKLLMSGKMGSAISSMAASFLALGVVLFAPSLLRSFLGETSESQDDSASATNRDIADARAGAMSSSAEPALSPAPLLTPRASGPSLDWDLLLMGGGVVLGLGALVGLVCGGLWFFSSLAEKKELRQERLRALQKRSESVRERSEAVTDAYSAYLFDVVRVVSLPALSDLEIHQTQEFIEAYQSMTGVSWDDTGLDDAELSRRELLVSQAEVSWQKALRFAERTRHTYFSLEEQKRLQNAQRLLAIALNTSSTEAERRLAYERAMKSLEGLVEITEPSRVALEQKVSLMISSTPHVEVPQGSLPSPVSRLPQEECSRR